MAHSCYTTLSGTLVRCRDAIGGIERVIDSSLKAGRVSRESLHLLRDIFDKGRIGVDLVKEKFMRLLDGLLVSLKHGKIDEARKIIHELLRVGSVLHDHLPGILSHIYNVLLKARSMPRADFQMQLAYLTDSLISTYCALDIKLEESRQRAISLALQAGLNREEVELMNIAFRYALSFIRAIACSLNSAVPLIT